MKKIVFGMIAFLLASQTHAAKFFVKVNFGEDGCPVSQQLKIKDFGDWEDGRCNEQDEGGAGNNRISDAICFAPGTKIIFRGPTGQTFQIAKKTRPNHDDPTFPNDPVVHPFNEPCKTGRRPHVVKCTVRTDLNAKKSYGYNIVANNCVLDPRIIITNNNLKIIGD